MTGVLFRIGTGKGLDSSHEVTDRKLHVFTLACRIGNHDRDFTWGHAGGAERTARGLESAGSGYGDPPDNDGYAQANGQSTPDGCGVSEQE